MTTTDSDTSRRSTGSRRIWRAGLVAAVVAAVANTLVYVLGSLTDASWQITQGGTTTVMPAFAPAAASVFGLALGTVALWVLARFSWGLLVWTIAAVVVGLGSVVSPLQAAEDTTTGILLAAMHVVALVVGLVVLRPAGRRG